jgi:dTDP-glucose 4,6-dehydratase
MKTLLITGGAGFIGSNFIRMILDEHPEIRLINLDKLTYAGNLENLKGYMDRPQHIFVKGDIGDADLVTQLVQKHGVEAIVNFAAESHVDRSLVDPGVFIETNIKGTLTLLKVALENKLERFVQVSTDEVYGSLGAEGFFTETTPLSPNSPYSASKASADMLVRAFGHSWGLPFNITRCSNNYGPYQFPEKMIPLMINNALNDKELPVYGDGLYIRDWLYVYDHCTAVWKVLTEAQPGTVYNIGGNNEKTNMEVVGLILRRLGKPETLIRHVKDRPGHDRRYAIDSTRIMTELNWKPAVTFEQGIDRTIDWYLSNQDWLNHVVSGQYQQYYKSMYTNR